MYLKFEDNFLAFVFFAKQNFADFVKSFGLLYTLLSPGKHPTLHFRKNAKYPLKSEHSYQSKLQSSEPYLWHPGPATQTLINCQLSFYIDEGQLFFVVVALANSFHNVIYVQW